MDRDHDHVDGTAEGADADVAGGTGIGQSPGHKFCEKLNELLKGAEFDRRVDELCAP